MNNNIERLRLNKNLSRQELANILGVTRQNIFDIEKGKIRLTENKIKSFCKVFNCSMNDLYDENLNLDSLDNKKIKTFIKLNYLSDIKFLNVANFHNDNKNYEILEFDQSFLKKTGVNDVENILLVKASIDSMYPTINNNDLLFVDTQNKQLLNGQIYLINENGLLQIKRLRQPNPMKKIFEIVSDNQNKVLYPTYEIDTEKDRLDIYGKIVFYCKILEN